VKSGITLTNDPIGPPRSWRNTAVRWLKFNAVGALGIAVQLATLLSLKSGLHLSYLAATALAVEAAVIHNFLWHERYTWTDRVRPSWPSSLLRLFRFNLTTGAVSIAGNLALMKIMVGLGHLHFLIANGIAIAVCSLANFLVSEQWVFVLPASKFGSDKKESPPRNTERLAFDKEAKCATIASGTRLPGGSK